VKVVDGVDEDFVGRSRSANRPLPPVLESMKGYIPLKNRSPI
jgi:hypothetical protein